MEAKEYSERGDKYFSEKNFDGAIADFSEVIKLEADNPFAYYKRGLSYTNKKEFDLAIADFTEAIRIEPNKFGDFYFDRAGAYVFKGNKDMAISDLEMAVKIDPQSESYRGALKDIKEAGPKSVETIKKELKVVLIGSIIGGIIGVILAIISILMNGGYDDEIITAIMVVWMGLGLGGNITFVPFLIKSGWNVFGLWKRLVGFATDIFGANAFFLLFLVFLTPRLYLVSMCLGIVAVAGPIWPLIRILMKRSQIKKMQ